MASIVLINNKGEDILVRYDSDVIPRVGDVIYINNQTIQNPDDNRYEVTNVYFNVSIINSFQRRKVPSMPEGDLVNVEVYVSSYHDIQAARNYDINSDDWI